LTGHWWLFGQLLETLGGLALGRVGGHHVAELDDDGRLRVGVEAQGGAQDEQGVFQFHEVSWCKVTLVLF
jgi:hypothetical protein